MAKKIVQDAALALLAAEFLKELDALLGRHEARLHFCWHGKRAKMAVILAADPAQQLTLIEVTKDKGARYVSPMKHEATPAAPQSPTQ